MLQIRTQIDIAASAERVWSVLTDFAAYPRWNPFLTSISGRLAVGADLTMRVAPPGGWAMHIRPRVTAVLPQRELHWQSRLVVPGLFDSERRFRLEPHADGVLFRQSERFDGVLVLVAPTSWFARMQTGFEAMNRALKRRAEDRLA